MVKLRTKKMKKVVLVRIYIETEDIQDGMDIVNLFEKQFSPIPLVGQEVKRYWKIPEYVEVITKFDPENKIEDLFEALINQLGTGWEYGGSEDEKWAIWNPSDLSSFSISKARWANVEIIDG
jgi:hypothetical protein